MALCATTETINVKGPVYPADGHWNEDPHSRPTPISGVKHMTSTEARTFADNDHFAPEPKAKGLYE